MQRLSAGRVSGRRSLFDRVGRPRRRTVARGTLDAAAHGRSATRAPRNDRSAIGRVAPAFGGIMKWYLAIESSSPRLSIAAGDERGVRARFTSEHQWRHADTLFDGLQAVTKRLRRPIASVGGVA